MKVAVSVPDDVFQQAGEQASRVGPKRSQLYARALEEFLARHEVDPVTQLYCADRRQLEEKITDLPFLEEQEVDDEIRLVLGL